MRWKQFLTPVESVTADEARQHIADTPELEILDVRQPGEYQEGHIAGAKLVPMGELGDRLGELERDKPVLVYCAIGGRSRVAAQLLAGKGFDKVLNLKGGIKAWNGWTGFGDYEQGLELFEDLESLEQALTTAYGMEAALEAFYSEQAGRTDNDEAKKVFETLAAIEVKHKDAVGERYKELTGKDAPDPEDVPDTPEGGLPTEEYMRRLGVDMDSATDIVGFAMAIEAQALDLYSRAAERGQGDVRQFLEHMAGEEKGHLQHLAKLMDKLHGGA